MAAFASRRLGDARLGAGFALLYPAAPPLPGITVRDIPPAAFATPLLITAAWAVDAGRPAWAAVAVVAALAGREDAAIAGVGFGVWLALARRRWAVGAAVAVACVALLWLGIHRLLPPFRGEPDPHLLPRFALLAPPLSAVLAHVCGRTW